MTNAQHNVTTNTEASTTDRYYAQPYDISGTGFFFDSFDSFASQAYAHRCEEFELQYIDGDEAELFEACGINQANLYLWFDVVQELADHEKPALFYCLAMLGYRLEDALDKVEDYPVTEGSALEYAESYIEDSGMLADVPEQLRYYFDIERFASDLLVNDISEFTYQGNTFTVNRW